MPPINLRRSNLFVPAGNARALAKAAGVRADTVIFDLEDSVAENDKPLARKQLRDFLSQSDGINKEVIVRVNGLQSAHCDADLQCLAELQNLNGVLLPMVNAAEDILNFSGALSNHGLGDLPLWCMIETPRAVFNIRAIAQTKGQIPQLDALVFGPNDLALATGVKQVPGRAPMLAWIADIILACKCVGLDFIDGVYADIDDLTGFQAECQQGYDMGAKGKSLIHPNQIDLCNQSFSPRPEEIRAAEKIVAAFQGNEKQTGAIKIDGKMVEVLHYRMAQNLLAIRDKIRRE